MSIKQDMLSFMIAHDYRLKIQRLAACNHNVTNWPAVTSA